MGIKLKHHFNRRLFLKYIAMIGIVSSFYPAIMTTRLIFFKTPGNVMDFILSASILLFSLLSGTLMAFGKFMFAARNDPTDSRKNIYLNLISILVGLAVFAVPAGAVLTVYSSEWIVRILFELAAAAVLYILSLRIQYQYTQVLDPSMLLVCVPVVSVTLLVVLCFPAYAQLRGIAFFAGYLLMASTMIVRNQARLDNVFTKDGRDIHNIPESIRTYNTMILTLLFIFTILLFNFKWIVMSLLGMAGVVLQTLLWLVYKLMSMLFVKGGPEVWMSRTSQNAALQTTGGGRNILVIILDILALLAALYASYKFIRQLYSSLFKKILAKLSKNSCDGIDDYSDEIEIVRPEEFGKGLKKIKKRTIRKHLNGITDPIEKIRYLYHEIIEALLKKDIDIQKSDTTGEICRKALQADSAGDYVHNATAVYDKVRYGDKVPDPSEVSQVEASYTKLADMLKRHL